MPPFHANPAAIHSQPPEFALTKLAMGSTNDADLATR